MVVPLVAFDDAGRRLGYGGGNYDQLLPRLRADAVVIGIAFDEPKPGIYTRIRLSGEARKVFEGSYDTANFQS